MGIALTRYEVPLATVGTPLNPLPEQRCTLPATFARVTDVELKIAGTLATAQFVSLSDLSYVLHKHC